MDDVGSIVIAMQLQIRAQDGYFVGTWTTQDGYCLVLRSDSTCSYHYIGAYKNLELYEGKWELVRFEGFIEDYFYISIYMDHFTRNFNVASENGLLFNRPPWYFYYILDADNWTVYEFKRSVLY